MTRLYTDVYGVTHWRYTMTGIMYPCGQKPAYQTSYEPVPPGFPTCIRCIVMTDREQDRVWL